MVFGRVSDIQTTYSSQFGSLGIIGLYPWTIVQIGLFYFEQFFRPKPQIYQYYTSSIYYIKQIFLNFYSDWIHRIPHIERLWNLGRSMEVQTHQNHELENISTKAYYFFTAPPLTHPPYSRSNVQSRFLSLCVKFVRRPEPPLPSASCHRQPSLLCMQASSTITGNTCICFLRPGADCWRPTCRNNVFWVGRRQCHAVDGIQTQDFCLALPSLSTHLHNICDCVRYFPFKRTGGSFSTEC